VMGWSTSETPSTYSAIFSTEVNRRSAHSQTATAPPLVP